MWPIWHGLAQAERSSAFESEVFRLTGELEALRLSEVSAKEKHTKAAKKAKKLLSEVKKVR